MKYRSLNKARVCDEIVKGKVIYDKKVRFGTLEVIDPKTNLPLCFNTKLFLNVLFSEAIRPLLATRGASLTKQELQEKLSTDQELWEVFIVEYNTMKQSYGTNAYPSAGFDQNAANFTVYEYNDSW